MLDYYYFLFLISSYLDLPPLKVLPCIDDFIFCIINVPSVRVKDKYYVDLIFG